jgi:hypothetical protein
MARCASLSKCLWRPESYHVLLKKGNEEGSVAVMIVPNVRSLQKLFVFRSLSSCEAARTCSPRGFNSTLSFLLLSAVPPATSSTVTYTQNKSESTCHRDIQIWYMLGRYRPSTFPRAILPNSIHLRPAVINQPRKPMPADDILTRCHYDLPLLLHVTTAEPLAGNSQKQAITDQHSSEAKLSS